MPETNPSAGREAGEGPSGRESLGALESAHHPLMYYRRRNDDAGSFVFAGGWSREVTGHPRARFEEEGGVTFADLLQPEDRDRVMRAIREGVRADRLFRIEYVIRKASGELRPVLDRCRAFWNEDGEVEFFEGVIIDPTLCDEMDRRIVSDEERFRAMMEASFEGIAIHDKGIYTDGNPAFFRMLGYSREELIGRPVLEVIAEEDHEMVMQRVRSGYDKPYHLTGIRKSGQRFPAQVRGKDVVYRGKLMRVVAVQDITVFKEAEETLRTANEKLEAKVGERTRELRDRQAELNRMNQALLRELALARKVQESLLPGRNLVRPGVSVAVTYLPALEVGGDAYQFIQLGDGRIAGLIADLTGHGIQAALSTVLVTSAFTSHTGQEVSPHEILRNMNASLRKGLPSGTYAAALVLTFHPESGRCEILNAGIPDPLLVRGDSPRVDMVSCRGPLLGVLEDDEYARFEARAFELERNDNLLLYTDGLDEVRNSSGEFFGRTRLRDLLIEVRGLSHEKVPDRLVSEARSFSGPFHAWDDITILSLLRTE